MSLFDRLFAGAAFRSRTPSFEVGQEVTAFVTGVGDEVSLVRIGDTVIELPDADPALLETRVRFEVEAFDAASSRGRGRVLEVLDERG